MTNALDSITSPDNRIRAEVRITKPGEAVNWRVYRYTAVISHLDENGKPFYVSKTLARTREAAQAAIADELGSF
jgi:hypothetical protein